LESSTAKVPRIERIKAAELHLGIINFIKNLLFTFRGYAKGKSPDMRDDE